MPGMLPWMPAPPVQDNAGLLRGNERSYTMLTTGSLKDLVGRCGSRQEKISLLAFEASYGSIDGWRIELSTMPGRVGASVMHSAGTLSEVKACLSGVSQLIHAGAFCPAGGWHCEGKDG